jgi:hypothetical protein
MISGVYSTVYIAAPILIFLQADRYTEALVKVGPAPGDPEAIEQAMLEKPPVERQ